MKLVSNQAGTYKIEAENAISPTDLVIPNELLPCKVEFCKNGYTFEETKDSSNFSIFYRGNPYLYEKAMQQALPILFCSFKSALKK